MRGLNSVSRGKNDASSRNGVSNGDKGVSLSAPRSITSGSDSDDDDVMRQLLSPCSRVTNANGRVATGRDVDADGPENSDDRGTAIYENEQPQRGSNPRSVRGVGPSSESSPVGSQSQTPGPNTSSSEGAVQPSNGMDVDSEEQPLEEQLARTSEPTAKETRELATAASQRTLEPVSYIACHTWPPCAVCARIAGIPTSTLAAARRMRPPPFFPPSVNLTLPTYGLDDTSRQAGSPLSIHNPIHEGSPLTTTISRPASDSRLSNSSQSPARSRPPTFPRAMNGNAPFPQPNYPMEPLFVSAGVAPTRQFRTLTPAHMATRGMPAPTQLPVMGRRTTLAAVTAPVRSGPYSRVPQRNAQASSSAVRIEDMDEPEPEGRVPGLTSKFRGKGKIRTARISGRKQRAKRYNRKKREEWPPEGWNPIWEEERPRNWGDYHISDEVVTDRVYDHLKKRFDLKSAGVCNWEGCKPANPDDPSYKMLKRHVETVHLGLKLVCKLCGVRKRADNRRKATHKRGCPEREVEEAKAKAKAAGAANAKMTANAQHTTAEPEEDSAEDEDMDDEEGEEEDELEEDELDEEDELEDDQSEDVGLGAYKLMEMESEFESEDD